MGQWWRHCCARREGCRVPGGSVAPRRDPTLPFGVPGGVSNSGSVPGGVSGGGIAALAAWVAQKKRHKPHFHSVTLAPRIIERY